MIDQAFDGHCDRAGHDFEYKNASHIPLNIENKQPNQKFLHLQALYKTQAIASSISPDSSKYTQPK
jgi:hypothetical protein